VEHLAVSHSCPYPQKIDLPEKLASDEHCSLSVGASNKEIAQELFAAKN
jgi:hypothetical protein